MRKALLLVLFLILVLLAGCISQPEGPVLPSREVVLPTFDPALTQSPGSDLHLADPSGPARETGGSDRPDPTEPSEIRPNPTEPSETRPNPTEPSETRPDPTQPSETRPDPTEPSETRPDPTQPSETRPDPTQPSETRPDPTEPPVTSPTTGIPEDTDNEPPAEELQILSVGPYAGPYCEDGSDEEVGRVASLLVRNPDKRHLQYAELHLTLNGKEAIFRISDLPPGKSVLVLEANRMEIYPDPDARFLAGKSVAFYKDPEAQEEHPELSFRSTGGNLTVTNNGRTTLSSVDVSFKLVRDEDVYQGGISYHVRFGRLAPGETRTVAAGHYDPERCEIVFIQVK